MDIIYTLVCFIILFFVVSWAVKFGVSWALEDFKYRIVKKYNFQKREDH